MTRDTDSLPRPVRIQRSRRKGAKMTSPNGLPVVYVGRPTKWGNPFRAEGCAVVDCATGGILYRRPSPSEARASAVRLYRAYLDNDGTQPGAIRDEGGAMLKALARDELRGKNLACWCKLGEPCHADVLLELAR